MGAAVPPALPALVLAQSQPTFYAAWDDARDSERRGRFAAALEAYRRAAELRPRPAAQVIIYGNNLLEGYYPYTRIARCALELGRWDEADQALARAEAEGEPPAERQALRSRLAAARPHKPAALPPAAQPPKEPPPPEPSQPLPPPAQPRAPSAPTVRAATPPAPVSPAPGSLSPLASLSHPEPTPRSIPGSEAPRPAKASTPPPAPPAPVPANPPPAAAPRRTLGFLGGGALILALAGAFLLGRRRKPAAGRVPGEPDRIGPFRVERILGRGGFATTYLARRPGDGAPVALKLLHAYRRDDPEFLRRFRQEAHLGSLLDHPNLVRILDQGMEEDLPWLAMEYVEGRTLAEELKQGGAMALPRVLVLARQVAEAMAYAHGQGVVHRDLKPSNVMIIGEKVKVMDFGIARSQDSETLTTTYAFLGTPQYAAPELQTRTRVGPEADRYSLGVMLFEMLAGHPPFQGETPFAILDQHRSRDLPDLAALAPAAPAALVDLVRRLTAKDPSQRPLDEEILAILA